MQVAFAYVPLAVPLLQGLVWDTQRLPQDTEPDCQHGLLSSWRSVVPHTLGQGAHARTSHAVCVYDESLKTPLTHARVFATQVLPHGTESDW